MFKTDLNPHKKRICQTIEQLMEIHLAKEKVILLFSRFLSYCVEALVLSVVLSLQ